ncbi:MAG TPA: hypothetical protein VFG34_02690 [Sphingopyxis sp.]|nr:hypothetical protein [Sphingopyxis sp.]
MAQNPNASQAADPDIITPKAPPEHPAQPKPPAPPRPIEKPDGQPLEMPDKPGGDDEIGPGFSPDELPD